MFKIIAILLISIAFFFNSFGQDWPQVFGDDISGNVFSIIEDYDNGYMIGGQINRGNIFSQWLWLIKTDVNGEILWEKKFGDLSYLTYLNTTIITSDSGKIIAGATSKYSDNLSHHDPLFIKLNTCGEIEWCRVLSSPNSNYGTGIIQLSDGSYIGMMKYYGARISLVKMDQYGEPLWIEHLAQEDSTIYNEEGYYLDLMNDGNYLVSGRCFCPGEKPFWIKTDTTGAQLWDLKWAGGSGVAHQTSEDANGQFYSSGGFITSGNPLIPTLFKFNNEGEVINQYSLLGDTIYAGGTRPLLIYNDTNLLIGIQWCMSPNYEEGFSEILMTDTLGIISKRRILIDRNRTPETIIKTFDNKILVSGNYYIGGNWDIYLWKLNSDLEDDTLYTQPFTYDSLCPYQIPSDTVDLNCSLFVDIDEIPTKEEYENNIRFYPNPASEIVTLSYAEQKSNKEAWIYVYNSFGILVKKIRIPDRQNQHTIDISSFPSGIYIAVLRNERKIMAKGKFIIAR